MRVKHSHDCNMAESDDGEMGEIEHVAEYSNDLPAHAAEEISRLLRETGINDISDIPDALIITNIDVSVFENDNSKAMFEQAFLVYNENATFQYFKSFRRARVNYTSPLFAANARINLNEADVCGQRIKCFFYMPISMASESDDPHLQPPALDKQFLISPPASPPIGWQPVHEGKPVINYDLLAALAQLTPGEAHELHPQSEDQPGIVVHVCEDPEGYVKERPLIAQTRCPDRQK